MSLKPLKRPAGLVCILAGGQSQRMGRPKSAVQILGKPMLEWVRAAASAVGWPVRVIDRDTIPGMGPLGGVQTAFATSRAERILFLSCDMPFITGGMLATLLRRLREKDKAVFSLKERLVGFPFVLRRNACPVVDSFLRSGERSLQNLARACGARTWPVPKSLFALMRNVNTPAQLDAAEEWAAQCQAADCVLQVRGLKIRRDNIPILRNVDWTIQPGEHWVILGANGSGKTSLLGALTGYMTPSAGEIWALGKKYGRSDWRQLRKRIGLVSSSIRQLMAESEPALHTVASGRQAVIDTWGIPSVGDLRAARKILRSVECGYLAERPWAVLSQGERQRVLIGRALMARPDLLILDEPCAGLDPVARERFLAFIERLTAAKSGPTLVLVTHHVEEITPGFSHVLMLLKGLVWAAGPRGKVLNSKNLSSTFGADMKLRGNGERLSARVRP